MPVAQLAEHRSPKPKVVGSTPTRYASLLRSLCAGALAQLGEHLPCKQEAAGSIPAGSTKLHR